MNCKSLDVSVIAHSQRGPLGPLVNGFSRLLSEQGYSTQVALNKIRIVALLSRWLEQQKIKVRQLNGQRIVDFLKARRKQLRRCHQVQRTLIQLLEHLRRLEIIPEEQPLEPQNPTERLIRDYGRFLAQERGLSIGTLAGYIPIARQFLSHAFGSNKVRLNKLVTADINKFILGGTSGCSRGWMQQTATALRSFLRFLYQRGQLATPLAASVPSVATWQLSDLPQFLEPMQVRRLLQSCDRSSPRGRRDYAILLLLAQLGLRAGEVAYLCLEDINWKTGEVLVRGKSSREDRLPLPVDAGRALAMYLRKVRPDCSSRRVFIRMSAPHMGLRGAAAISTIVRCALARAQLHPERTGAHLLRHSLATQMLRGGASLTQIGQILRHQLSRTTEIYAKVDLVALRALAQPWPGGVQ